MDPRATILYVEDERDMRELMSEALAMEGFDVRSVATAEAALEVLANGAFDVLLTDYRLPRESGAWLLSQATNRGYLDRTPAIVMSAEVDPVGIDSFPLLAKPVDFEVLLSTIRAAIGPLAEPVTPVEVTADVVLVLYVMPDAPESRRAERRMQRSLAKFQRGKVDLVIVDARAAAAADGLDEDRIIATPTLVKKHPGPKIWFVGNLSDSAAVEDMIKTAIDSGDDRAACPN